MANLSDIQIDALKEMGNIGSGNAATALSQLICEVVRINVPAVKVLPLNQVPDTLGGPEKVVFAVYLEVLSKMQGTMLTTFSEESAMLLVGKLLGGPDTDIDSEISQSALKELGSILCGSYLSALSQVVGMSSIASVPAITYDMLGAVLDFILIEIGQVAEEVLIIETELFVADEKLECTQIFLPKPEALEMILSSLGM